MKQIAIINPSSISELSNVLISYNKKNIFLLRGKKSFEVCGAESKLKEIFNTFNVCEFSDFSNNPKYDEAVNAYAEFIKSKSDILLAIGGGSVIDMAKLVKHFYSIDNRKNFLPFIAIPTTAGTGSEATCFAVVYKNGIKESIESEILLPNHAIIDSELLVGQSAYQMAVSGIDAFSQGIESYWNINATDESMHYAEQAIKLMWENLESAIAGNIKALEQISKGSFLAGKAINITKTTAPHALSYGFTSQCDLPHGHAVALFLPFFAYYNSLENHYKCNDTLGTKNVSKKIFQIENILNIKHGTLSTCLYLFISKINIEISFANLKINKNKFNEIISNINQERLKNNPYIINKKDVVDIFNYNSNLKINN